MKMTAGNKKENNYQLNIWDDAKKDIDSLDDSQLIFVKKSLKRIKKFGLNCGSPLHGELEGYRKLKNRKMGLRIVFGKDARNKIRIIDIVAIGKCRRYQVYHQTLNRIISK